MTEQSYTTLEQSQKLFKLLGHGHCADMTYTWEHVPETGWEGYDEPIVGAYDDFDHSGFGQPDIPCWSLTGLINLLPDTEYSICASYPLVLIPSSKKAGYIDMEEYYEEYHVEKAKDLFTATYNLVLWAIKNKEIE
jgi:hypothetical protein